MKKSTIKIKAAYKYKDTRQYWYSTDVYICVMCGREIRYRERVYDQSKSGCNYIDDACGCHF